VALLKLAYHIWIVILTVFLSSFVSALAISALLLEMSAFYIVVIFCFFGTVCAGMPLSLLIYWVVKPNHVYGIAAKLLLHAAAGVLIVQLCYVNDSWSMRDMIYDGRILYIYSAIINAVIYFAIYALLRRTKEGSF
jgi:hypothetical protein